MKKIEHLGMLTTMPLKHIALLQLLLCMYRGGGIGERLRVKDEA